MFDKNKAIIISQLLYFLLAQNSFKLLESSNVRRSINLTIALSLRLTKLPANFYENKRLICKSDLSC